MITVFHTQRDDSLKMVASVSTDEMEYAWQLTNHIDSDWTDGVLVTVYDPKARSSMVGDVFFNHATGKFKIVDSFGFADYNKDNNRWGRHFMDLETLQAFANICKMYSVGDMV